MNTAKVSGRRGLRFNSIDEAISEADRIAAADAQGKLHHIGNWSPGQCLNHVAAWIEYGYDGYPMRKPPWFIRVILRLRLKKMLESGMPAGVKIPRAPGGTYGFDDTPTADAAERFRKAFLRLKRGEASPYDSPAFGPMSHEDRIRLNLRHAELHLSFLQIDE